MDPTPNPTPTPSGARQSAPACARNRDPILAVLRDLLPATGRVLEIAAGSGEHAVYFSAAFPNLHWQPADVDAAALASIEAWAAADGGENLAAPIRLDVTARPWPVADGTLDAVLCINMIHISPWAATVGLMTGAGAALKAGGVLYLYGPYKMDGRHTAPSNERFEGWLKDRDPSFGVRDLAAVQAEAEGNGLAFLEARPMPANNFSVIFRKGGA